MTSFLHRLLQRVRSSFSSSTLDGDLDAEMVSHIELAVEENLRNGMFPDEARRQALIRFGGFDQAKQQQRDAR